MSLNGRVRLLLAAFMVTVAGSAICRPSALAGDEERMAEAIYVDPTTGYAIDGFDPVSFFIDGRGRPGRQGLEVRHGGAYWRFANEGNRAAFAQDPAVFAPAFGGYGAVAMARGIASAGNPALFAIHEGRLYFFTSEGNRQVFLRDPSGIAAAAARNWQDISGRLPR